MANIGPEQIKDTYSGLIHFSGTEFTFGNGDPITSFNADVINANNFYATDGFYSFSDITGESNLVIGLDASCQNLTATQGVSANSLTTNPYSQDVSGSVSFPTRTLARLRLTANTNINLPDPTSYSHITLFLLSNGGANKTGVFDDLYVFFPNGDPAEVTATTSMTKLTLESDGNYWFASDPIVY